MAAAANGEDQLPSALVGRIGQYLVDFGEHLPVSAHQLRIPLLPARQELAGGLCLPPEAQRLCAKLLCALGCLENLIICVH
jgi:hypothetical protein